MKPTPEGSGEVPKGRGRMGINLATDLKCPSCGTHLPAWRFPRNLRQFLWGGHTCKGCGKEFDKWLNPVG